MRPSAGAQMESIQGPYPQRALSSVRGGPRNFPPQDCQTQMSSWSTRENIKLGYSLTIIWTSLVKSWWQKNVVLLILQRKTVLRQYCPIHIFFRLIRMTLCETTFPSGIMGKEYHGQAILHVHVYLPCCVLTERVTVTAQSPHDTDLQADW